MVGMDQFERPVDAHRGLADRRPEMQGAHAVPLDDADVPLDRHMRLVEAQRSPVARIGIGHPAERPQRRAVVGVKLGVPRHQGDCPGVARRRLVETSEAEQRATPLIVRVGVVGAERQDLVILRQRLVVALRAELDVAAAVERFSRVRFQGERLLVARQGILVAAQLEKDVAAIDMGLGKIGLERDRLVVVHEAILRSAGLGQQVPVVEQDTDIVRTHAQGRLEQVARFRDAALLEAHHTHHIGGVELIGQGLEHRPAGRHRLVEFTFLE